jgi:hypothetical protein
MGDKIDHLIRETLTLTLALLPTAAIAYGSYQLWGYDACLVALGATIIANRFY